MSRRGKEIIAVTDPDTVTVIELRTGEVLSVHDIDPARSYWRNKQRSPGSLSLKSRHRCLACRDSRHKVDLLRRYSNRADLLTRLREACEMAVERDAAEAQLAGPTLPARLVPTWRVRNRLSDDDVQALIADYLAGMSARALAERYEISVSALKALLKRHGVRRNP